MQTLSVNVLNITCLQKFFDLSITFVHLHIVQLQRLYEPFYRQLKPVPMMTQHLNSILIVKKDKKII